jgi:outer membrane lipoprotein-sorting protein
MSYGFQITTGTGASTVEISNATIAPGLALDTFPYSIARSTTTITISGSGTATFTLGYVANPRSFTVGQTIRAADVNNVDTVYIQGVITGVTSTSVSMNITSSSGSGTYSAWIISTTFQKDYTNIYPGSGLYVVSYNIRTDLVMPSQITTSGKILTMGFPQNTAGRLCGSGNIVVYGV